MATGAVRSQATRVASMVAVSTAEDFTEGFMAGAGPTVAAATDEFHRTTLREIAPLLTAVAPPPTRDALNRRGKLRAANA